MPTPLTQVADAIVAELNAAAGSGAFGDEFVAMQARRSYACEDMKLRDVGVLRVDVIPSVWQTELATRNSVKHTIGCDIGVRYRFPDDFQDAETGLVDSAPVDDLVALLHQLWEYFMPATDSGDPRQLTDLPGAAWESTEIKAPFVPQHLEEMQQYTGIVQVTFAVYA